MTSKESSLNPGCARPEQTSTLDFERYVPTTPILSCRDLGWESIMVRAYQELAEVKEEMFVPTAPDLFLALITSGVLHVECRHLDAPRSAMRPVLVICFSCRALVPPMPCAG